jgi:hypothetical protein
MENDVALQTLLDHEIFTFDGRDFANWLKAGVPVYYGAKAPMPGQRVPDAFPCARGFIGRNEAGLADDLKNVYDLLPSVTQVAMERGIVQLWAETEFRDAAQIHIAKTLLTLGCKLQVKALVDVLPESLALLAIAYERGPSDSARRQISQIRRQAFQAAIELASSSSPSIRCLELFVEDTSIDEPLLVQGQALKIVRYLSIKFASRFIYWAGIFGRAIVADYKAEGETPQALRAILEKDFGEQNVQFAIELVRDRKVDRIQIENGALSLKSMRGLYDLAPILHAGRKNAARDEVVELVTYPWDVPAGAVTTTAEVINFDRKFLKEVNGW